MSLLHRVTTMLALGGGLLLSGCGEVPTAATPDEAGSQPMLKKGGPPGGGGGGSGGGAVANPVFAFHNNGGMWIMNEDGSNRTQLVQNNCSVSRSSWSPSGDGTVADPYRVINWSSCARKMVVASFDTLGGAIHVGATETWNYPGGPEDVAYGAPAWQPGTGMEVAVQGSWQANPSTNEWRDALYVVSVSELPNPSSQLLYEPPAGCGMYPPAWSPDGASIAFGETCDAGGVRIQVLDRSSGVVTTLVPFGVLAGGYAKLDWSRSGESLAFDTGQEVYTLRLGGGQMPVHVASGLGASWSPDQADSRLMFSTTGKSKLRIADLAAGSLTRAGALGSGEMPDWRRQ